MKAKKVYDLLNELGVTFDILEHEAAYTVEEMEKVLPKTDAKICKNLFLRDQKGKQHYLIVMAKEKPFDLRTFGDKQGLGKLSFASEKRLIKYLNVESGSVSPFGLMNDASNHVVVYIDNELKKAGEVGFHPSINTATITFSIDSLQKYFDSIENDIYWVNLV